MNFKEGDTVRVVDAPGYEDFTGTLVLLWDDWPDCFVDEDEHGMLPVPVSSLREFK